jgi:LPS-assembly lipoprotein
MLIKRRLVFAFMLVAAAMLSACGFHLRGSGNQAELPFKTIYLGFPDTSSLGNELKRYIASSGSTAVVTDPKAAEAVLEPLAESKNKQIISLNSQGRVREYALNYRLLFQVRDSKNNILLAPTDINIRRLISFNESQVLAKESEETMLYRSMQTDLVQQVLWRLTAIKPAQQVKPDQKG